MLKKFFAVLTVLAVFSTTVFALPSSAAVSLNNQNNQGQGKAEASEALADFDAFQDGDLFADVKATQLTDEEAQAVEGEGFWGALIGGIVCGGAALTGIVILNINNPPKTLGQILINTGAGIMAVGVSTGIGIVGGALLPF